MPPLPVVPNVIRGTLKFSIGDDIDATVRLHWSYTGTPPNNAACASFAASAATAATAQFAGVMADDTTLETVEFQDLSSTSGGFGSASPATAGTRGSALLPASTCALLSMAVARRYRGGKPRAYFPFGISTDLLTANQWSTSAHAAFLTAINNWQIAVDGLVSGGCTIGVLVNVSYYEGFTSVTNPITGRTKDVAKLRTGGPVVDIITGITVNPRPASQRRRNLTV